MSVKKAPISCWRKHETKQRVGKRRLRLGAARLLQRAATWTLESMDSRAVNKEIRRSIWSALRDLGFSAFSSRTAWRYAGQQIEVINFQSFNRYKADVLGITTFSFAVNLGSYLSYIPPQWPPKVKDGKQVPEESSCHFRGRLSRKISQSHKYTDIWLVEDDGRNLGWCIRDVQQQLPLAMQWFERLRDKNEVLRILLKDSEQMGSLWGFGKNPSPIRSYLSGYVALSLGQREIAQSKLKEAAESKCFVHLFNSVEGAMTRAL